MGYMNNQTRKAKTKRYVPTDEGGNKGVRASMTNMGLDNSRIGWKDGTVTYGNNSFKPSSVKDGVSYAPVSDIQGFVNDIYKSEGKNPVRVTDYVSPAGMGSISYSDNGMVSVGGENIPVLYMDGDRAVVDEKALDNAYKKLMKKSGTESAGEMYDNWQSMYKRDIDDAYGRLSGYKDWSYNPEEDPAYQAYSDMYKREGERAYRDAAAKMASKNNGSMTSAAQTLANQQLAYYMSMLADRIPELEKNSYDRYKNGYEARRDEYNMITDRANDDWNKKQAAQKLAREDYQETVKNEQERTDNANKLLDSQFARRENERKAADDIRSAAWENAEKRGYFTEEEAKLWNIPKNEDGRYLTPNEIKIQKDVQYFNEASKPQLAYKSDLEIEQILEKYRAQRENDAIKSARQLANSKNLAAYKAGLKNK